MWATQYQIKTVNQPEWCLQLWQLFISSGKPAIGTVRRHHCKHSKMQNKRHAVAMQTTQSCCKVLSIQYVYYFRDYQSQRTLHGVCVIIKLYFAILRHLRKHWPWISLIGHSRSYILMAIESQCTTLITLYRSLIVAFALSSTVSEILPALYARPTV